MQKGFKAYGNRALIPTIKKSCRRHVPLDPLSLSANAIQYGLDYGTTKTETLMTETTEWVWKDLPEVPEMVPCLLFLYGGCFSYEDQIVIHKSLEMYDCPTGSSKICLGDAARVLVIYQHKNSGTGV